MRFAFVTTELPLTKPHGGGSGTYVTRMTALLAGAGHEVDIFIPVDVLKSHLQTDMDWNGCRVHHVRPRRSFLSRGVNGLLRTTGFGHLAMKRYWLARARAIGKAIERIHARTGFDVVHSGDSYGIGLGVVARPGRLFVIRCSAAIDLYLKSDGQNGRQAQIRIDLEETLVQRADYAFAPSLLTARHYSQKLGIDVAVLPTPVYAEIAADGLVPPGTPLRYLLHFANDLSPRKGTDLVEAALPLAVAQSPRLTMIWVGRIDETQRKRLLVQLGSAADRVVFLPRQEKAVLYSLIRSAVCSVLPSRIDNLPNAVLESLMLGVPVIGTRESSIEELVEDGVTGVLIENGSVPELAAAMAGAWQATLGWQPFEPWAKTTIGRVFAPEAALAAYLDAIAIARRAQPKDTST